jgi:tungstate transport system ATP-binding protein
MSLLEVVKVEQRYGSMPVLKDVSLSVERGEIMGLIGPTGAGKTTLLRLVDQLETPTLGRIIFNGLDATSSPKLRAQVRRQVGMVFQKPAVFNLSVFDNVAYPLRIRGYARKSVAEKVAEMLDTVGLRGYERRNAKTLSGGETQKVAIARALVTGPLLMLLDEPTANLDPVSLASMEELIRRVNQQYGTAMIMATHDMSQGQRLANRIGVMMDGELIQVGRPSDIFYAPSDVRVARFVGVENILEGRIVSNEDGLAQIRFNSHLLEAVTDCCSGDDVHVFIRPEEITISLESPSSSARNTLSGEIKLIGLSGPVARVEIDCGFNLVSLITRRSAEGLAFRVGQGVRVSFKATAVHVISRSTAGVPSQVK